MREIFSAPAVLLIWLVGFALAAALAGLAAWCLAFRKGRAAPRAWAIWSAASLLPASLAFWDIFHRVDPGFVGSFVLVLETLLLAGVAAVFYVLGARRQKVESASRKTAAASPKSPGTTRRLSWALIALNVAAAGWAGYRLYECTAVDDAAYLASLADWLPQPAREARAVTDRGGSISLYTPVANPAAVVPHREALAAAEARRFVDRRIKRRDSTPPCNCHGWVFTAGKYFLSPDDVEKILVENDYRQVAKPKAGDLIIYRDTAGNIVHSGVVRLVEGELVIVESQWGTNARYLHEPAGQGYSSSFEYYRSTRTGHTVRIIDAPERDL